MKKHAIAASVALRLALAAAICTLAAASALAADDAAPQGVQARLIKQGEYLSRAGDCIACHTAKGGKPYAGGLGIDSPLGVIYSTNITPDRTRASATTATKTSTARCVAASPGRPFAVPGHALYLVCVHQAGRRQGALCVFHAWRDAGQAGQQDTDIVWPLSMRWPLGMWRWMFAPDAVAAAPAAPSRARRRAPTRERCCAASIWWKGWAIAALAIRHAASPCRKRPPMPLKGRPFSRAAWSRAGWPEPARRHARRPGRLEQGGHRSLPEVRPQRAFGGLRRHGAGGRDSTQHERRRSQRHRRLPEEPAAARATSRSRRWPTTAQPRRRCARQGPGRGGDGLHQQLRRLPSQQRQGRRDLPAVGAQFHGQFRRSGLADPYRAQGARMPGTTAAPRNTRCRASTGA